MYIINFSLCVRILYMSTMHIYVPQVIGLEGLNILYIPFTIVHVFTSFWICAGIKKINK